MNKTVEKITAKYPVGMKVRYDNPGNRSHGWLAKVTGYLQRVGVPDKISHIELAAGRSRQLVTVDRLRKYYTVES